MTLGVVQSECSEGGIQKINLRTNQIKDMGAQALVEMLKGNDTLTELTFFGNPIGATGKNAFERLVQDKAKNRRIYFDYY
jgi:hypothetical protein